MHQKHNPTIVFFNERVLTDDQQVRKELPPPSVGSLPLPKDLSTLPPPQQNQLQQLPTWEELPFPAPAPKPAVADSRGVLQFKVGNGGGKSVCSMRASEQIHAKFVLEYLGKWMG